MKKRMLALLLAGMMLLSATACDSREQPEVEEPEAPVETPAEPPKEEEKKPEENPEEEEKEVELEIPDRKEQLKADIGKNPDIVGWLQIPDTKVDAPVVQGNDNNYYLRRTYYGENNKLGCYFADFEGTFGATADDLMRNTVIYGHNIDYGAGAALFAPGANVGTDAVDEKDGERFSQLFHYADIEWAKEHPYLYFHMPEEELTWEVFAVSYVPTNFNYIQILKDSKVSKTEQITPEQMMTIVEGARARSEYDYDVEVNEDDKILTLSTCTYKYGKNSNIRFIIMAKLVTEDDTLVETANITPNADKVAAK